MMLDGLRVVIRWYLTILCCPSINFFVRTTNSKIAEGLLLNIKENVKAIFLGKKKTFESILFFKVILYKSQKKQTYLAAIQMQIVVTSVRKVLYCV